jgi:hypothetical protein
VLGESCIIIKNDGLTQRGCDAVEDGQHDRDGFSGSLSNEPRRKRHTGFALMENEHGPCVLADDEIALPMAGLGSGVDSLIPAALGTDRRAISCGN